MNKALALFLTLSLSALAASEKPAAAIPPAMESWQQTLLEQTEPKAYLSHEWEETGRLSEEGLEECAEAREHATTAIAAASALFSARLDIIRTLVDASSIGADDETRDMALSASEAILAECFWRDLRALASENTWLDYEALELPARPGRQHLRHLPACLNFLPCAGDTHERSVSYATINGVWERMQDHFLTLYTNYYREEGDSHLPRFRHHPGDPFTGNCYDKDDADTRQHMDTVLKLFEKENTAWKAYRRAMEGLICPSRGYRGTGNGLSMSIMERHMLDSRIRFLCLLATGAGYQAPPSIDCEQENELLELHPGHPYGEIFTTTAVLFRHKGLEGQPWCIRFPGVDAGFIPVQENEVLRSFLAKRPQGGECHPRGYQNLEIHGHPYEEAEDDAPQARPGGRMALRQTYVMLDAFVPEEPEANY